MKGKWECRIKVNCHIQKPRKITVFKNECYKSTKQRGIVSYAKGRVSINVPREDEPGEHSTW